MPSKISFDRLEFCNFKLSTLLKITQAINDNLSTEQLLNEYENLLKEDLQITKVLLFSYNQKWNCILKTDTTISANAINVEKDLIGFKEITTTLSSASEAVRHFDMIIPIFHNNIAIAYLLIGDIDGNVDGLSPSIRHLSFIQTVTNIIVVAIENRRLQKDNIQQETFKKELELASKIQAMLIPNLYLLPSDEYIFVDAYYFPHYEVGGDYYDFIKLNESEYGFCIADVSGKGISAALLMSNFQANLRALFTLDISLTELIKKLNERVISATNADKFVTLFVGKYNHKTRTLNYINAGHNPPILYNKHTQEISYLEKGSLGLGMVDEIPRIEERSITFDRIESGEEVKKNSVKLLCYTDGLVELNVGDDVEYVIQTLERCISNDKMIDKTINDIILTLKIKKQNDSIFDDISILGIEFF